MENRTKRDISLINLVSEFEANYDNGDIEFLDEKTFYQLIHFYEDELLLEKAIEVVDIALDQYKYRSDFYIIKARLLLNSNKTDRCIEYLDKAEVIAPFENEITLLRARALAIKGDFDKSLASLQHLKRYGFKSDLIDIHICESFIYERMKDYQSMYDILSKALLLDPTHKEALERMWIAIELSRKYEDSITFHEKLLDRKPYSSLAWYNLGHSYACIGEYEKAIDAMEYSFIIDPGFLNGFLDCADMCFQTKKYNRALAIYMEAEANFGPESELLVNMAECLLHVFRYEEAKLALYKAIKIDPYNDEAYYHLGESFSKEKNWYGAINAYHKAISLEDGRDDYFLGVAKAYVAVEDYNKATLNFKLATQTGPEQSDYWKEFVCFLLKMGLYNEALSILDEAEDYTFGVDLLYCRAATYLFLKNKNEGMSVLAEALTEDFEIHNILFEVAPELEVDKEITSMIKYFEGELELTQKYNRP